MKKTPLPPALALDWASAAHAFYLDALMSESMLSSKQIAFHGGTSLHLSWKSPRYSEDLDFLLTRESIDLKAISNRIQRAVAEHFFSLDPGFIVELRDKTKDLERMPVYQLVVSHPKFYGSVMVKAEFWRVTPEYLANYPTQFKSPVPHGDMVSRVGPVPAATLETAYCDKLTAFSTRPYLKWRDIYDLWWIGTQTGEELDINRVCEQFLHNVSAYTTLQNLPPADALRLFLKNDPVELIKKADPDLKKWLPAKVWAVINPDGVKEMVEYVFYALKQVADHLDSPVDDSKAGSRILKRARP